MPEVRLRSTAELPGQAALSMRALPAHALPGDALVLPARDETARESALDTHALPPSLIVFARRMSERMSAARDSSPEAQKLFLELESCAAAEPASTPRSARALCIENARVLSRWYTRLGLRYQAMRQTVEPEVARLLTEN